MSGWLDVRNGNIDHPTNAHFKQSNLGLKLNRKPEITISDCNRTVRYILQSHSLLKSSIFYFSLLTHPRWKSAMVWFRSHSREPIGSGQFDRIINVIIIMGTVKVHKLEINAAVWYKSIALDDCPLANNLTLWICRIALMNCLNLHFVNSTV